MNIKKIVLIIIAILIVFGIGFVIVKSGDGNKQKTDKIQVVASNFASYDFLRAIIGNNDDINTICYPKGYTIPINSDSVDHLSNVEKQLEQNLYFWIYPN